MLIPGLPPAGAQNDAIKSSREVKPSAASEPLHDAATPQVERRRRKRRVHTRQEQSPEERQVSADELELPEKGLLVDIEV